MNSPRLSTLILIIVAVAALPTVCWGASYFVDAKVGSDDNPGTERAPWRSVGRVNRAALEPGDAVSFRRGQRWDELLRPASGASRRPVSYGGYGRGSKPSIGGARVKGKSHLLLKDLELKSVTDDYPLYLEGSHHVTAADCLIIAEPSSKAYAAAYLTDSHRNRIVRCTIERRDTLSQGDAVCLKTDANYNLLEGNKIGAATHYAVFLEGATAARPQATANCNIIRGNRIWNREGAALSIVSNADRNLVEGNDIRGGKSTSFNANAASSFQLVTRNNIVRRNVIRDNASEGGYGLQMIAYRYRNSPPNQILDNRIYNNVIINVARYPVVLGNYEPRLCRVSNNKLVNNVICGASPQQVVVEKGDNIAGNSFRNNIVCEAPANRSVMMRGSRRFLRELQGDDGQWGGNIGADPKLNAGFRPSPGSPAVDAGRFLTEVTSPSGLGSSLVVEDAGWFSDGFGISEGDTVVIGASTAVIAAIDYGSNTITLEKPVSWKTGDPVSLPYRGKRPDIGAFEGSGG